MRAMDNPKSQTPGSRETPKTQSPMERNSLWKLKFGASPGFEILNLRFLRLLACASAGFALLALPMATYGVERFPPPEFDSGYKMPVTTVPAARALLLSYVDVAVLAVTLALASYLALKKRSRDGLLALSVFSLLYFGFYQQGCVCSIGSVQDVALAVFNGGYTVPLTTLAFFLLPLVFALFFGRTFCAAVCPMGAMQDLTLLKPVRTPEWLDRALSIVPFVYLGAGVLFAATGSAFLICEYDPFVALYRRSGSFGMLALGAAFLVIGIFIGRPYCRYLCPYGALLSLASRFAKWNVTLSPTDCLHCQICDTACPYGAIADPTLKDPHPHPRRRKRRMIALVALVPLLALLGGWLGGRLSVPFSRLHATVSLAEQVAAEDAGKSKEPTDASKAFRQTGQPVEELYAAAYQVRDRFTTGGRWFGVYVGLVIGATLLLASEPRKHAVYDPNPADCVACGRCYVHCPKEIVRVKRLAGKKIIPLTPVSGS
jgi:NosR/NirI family transcriptional regulator, nitrous oxide reductase regulator